MVSDVLEHAGAVADAFGLDARAVEHRDVEIRHRRGIFQEYVAAGLEGAAAGAREDHGKLVVIVSVAIADGAAVDDHRVFQHGFSVGVLHRIECANEAGESFHVPAFDLRDL